MARSKKDPVREKFASELASLIPSLDTEGLAFLVQQAHVHLYNMAVTAQETAEEAQPQPQLKGKKSSSGKTAGKKSNNQVSGTGHSFRLERNASGGSYHLIDKGRWKLFSDDEMLAMVRIAQGTGKKDPLSERTERLVRWFTRERSDVFADLELASDPHDPALRELTEFLAKKFAVKKE